MGLLIGRNGFGRYFYNNVTIANNTFKDIWNIYTVTNFLDCNAILAFGMNYDVYGNYVEHVYSDYVDGNGARVRNEGIYFKVQTSLKIHDNTLIDAGGRPGTINVKTGRENSHLAESGGYLTADTKIYQNTIYRTSARLSGIYTSKNWGIHVNGNHADIYGNYLYDPSNPPTLNSLTGTMIVIGGGGDFDIHDNHIKYPGGSSQGMTVALDNDPAGQGGGTGLSVNNYFVYSNNIEGLGATSSTSNPRYSAGILFQRYGANPGNVFGVVNTVSNLNIFNGSGVIRTLIMEKGTGAHPTSRDYSGNVGAGNGILEFYIDP